MLWKILRSVLNKGLSFGFRTVVVKFVTFTALYLVTTIFIGELIGSGFLPNSARIDGAFQSVPSSVWYFLDVLNLTVGIPIILSAYVTRFVIRRIPVIG